MAEKGGIGVFALQSGCIIRDLQGNKTTYPRSFASHSLSIHILLTIAERDDEAGHQKIGQTRDGRYRASNRKVRKMDAWLYYGHLLGSSVQARANEREPVPVLARNVLSLG